MVLNFHLIYIAAEFLACTKSSSSALFAAVFVRELLNFHHAEFSALQHGAEFSVHMLNFQQIAAEFLGCAKFSSWQALIEINIRNVPLFSTFTAFCRQLQDVVPTAF